MVSYQISRDALIEGDGSLEENVNGPVPAIASPGTDEEAPSVMVTMNRADLNETDHFVAGYGTRSDDLGKTWQEPSPYAGLGTRAGVHPELGEVTTAAYDWWPGFHSATDTLLATGNTIKYHDGGIPDSFREQERPVAYATYDSATDTWSEWESLELPDCPEFRHLSAGYGQWYESPDGTVLLPVACQLPGGTASGVTVLACSFDGERLAYETHGEILSIDDDNETRGLKEPSLTWHDGRFFLTIRNDERGYVTRSDDGQSFEPLREWTFTSGRSLGSYNTQQHWVAHSDGLFLVYTRIGPGGDRVFRHRAPLLMAEVDPERLRVRRETERVLVPDRGARMGCFGTANVSPRETWVTTAEFLQHAGRDWLRRYYEHVSADGTVHLVRVRWDQPNAYARTSE